MIKNEMREETKKKTISKRDITLSHHYYRGVSTSICRAIKKHIRGAICFLSADNARSFYHVVSSPRINDANNSKL